MLLKFGGIDILTKCSICYSSLQVISNSTFTGRMDAKVLNFFSGFKIERKLPFCLTQIGFRCVGSRVGNKSIKFSPALLKQPAQMCESFPRGKFVIFFFSYFSSKRSILTLLNKSILILPCKVIWVFSCIVYPSGIDCTMNR